MPIFLSNNSSGGKPAWATVAGKMVLTCHGDLPDRGRFSKYCSKTFNNDFYREISKFFFLWYLPRLTLAGSGRSRQVNLPYPRQAGKK